MTTQITQLIAQGATIIDVRSPAEFRQGANPKSVNIPIDRFSDSIATLDPNQTYVLCCASGGRSGMAEGILRSKGFKNVVNAGPWQNTMA